LYIYRVSSLISGYCVLRFPIRLLDRINGKGNETTDWQLNLWEAWNQLIYPFHFQWGWLKTQLKRLKF